MDLAGVAATATIISLVVGAALVATAPHWLPLTAGAGTAPATTNTQPDPRIADLAARVEALAARPASDPAGLQSLRSELAQVKAEAARLGREMQATAERVAAGGPVAAPAGPAYDDTTLQQRLARVEQQIGDALPGLERARNLRGEMDTLVAEVSRVGERSTGLQARLGEVEKETAARRDEDARAAAAARAAALVSLGTRVRQAVAQGQDSSADLAALKALAGDDAGLAAPLEKLQPLAGKPLATLDDLRLRFPAVARDIVTADAGDQAGTWWEKAIARLQGLVAIRRTGPEVAGDDAEARVAQAEAALRAGRLDQAVAALKPLGGQAAVKAAPWLADAEAALAAQAAADAVVARAAALLMENAPRQGTTAAPATR